MTNKKLTKRVNKLLENKNIDFKRKFYLLSYLSNTKASKNSKIMSEADCYINTLINTNGKLPKEKYIASLIKNTLKLEDNENFLSRSKKIFELNNMINPTSSILSDSIILEELDSSLNMSNFKVDQKLKEVLLESINKEIPILLKEAYGDDDSVFNAEDLLGTYIDDKKIDVPKSKSTDYADRTKSLVKSSVESDDDVGRKAINTSWLSKEKEVVLQYDWLLKKSKIPFIRSKLKFYLPTGNDADYLGDNLEKLPIIDKLTIISRYKLIVEQNATNSAMRKWEIIHKIQFYLGIQKQFMDDEIVAMGLKDLKKNKQTFTASPSGVPEESYDNSKADSKAKIRNDLETILSTANKSQMASLNSDSISEASLIALLVRSAGRQKNVVHSYIEYLNKKYPDSKTTSSNEVLSDDEYQKYIVDDEDFVDASSKEDKEDYEKSGIDPETGEPFYTDPSIASNISKSYKQEDTAESINMTSKEAFSLLKQNILDVKVVEKLTKVSSQQALSPELQKALDSAHQRLSSANSVKINILPDKSKGEVHLDLLDAMDHMDGINSIDAKSGRITSDQWEKFIEENIDVDSPMSHSDIAKVSQGAYRDTGGVRQDMTKQWFKSLFYSTDLEMKAELYAELGKKYIDAIRGMDLVEDSVTRLEGMNKATEADVSNFSKIESIVTSKEKMEEYFSGYADVDDDDYIHVDELVGGLTSFRIFVTWFLKDFYANHVWNKAEAKLAYAVKEYFDKFHKNARIGENLNPGEQSKHVKKEFGKSIFNFIIYWTMGRTGIKDKGNVLPNPKLELEQRQKYFLNKINNVISDYNDYNLSTTGDASRSIQNFNPEQLMNDCLSTKSVGHKPIIGSVWDELSLMNSKNESDFKEYINSKNSKQFELKFIESALMREYYEEILKNPLKPLGNPSEVKAIEKGSGSEKTSDKGKPESYTGVPYWYRLYKDKIRDANASKDLATNRDKKAADRASQLSATKDYSFLEDRNLDLNAWNVIYKGEKVEVKDAVDIESGKIEIIIDILNSNGDIIDGEEKVVSIDDVFPVRKV